MSDITAKALYDRIQHPNDLLLLDVRTEESFDRWRIEAQYGPDLLHIPYFEFIESETREMAVARVSTARDVVVVCAHGGASEYVAAILRKNGVRALNLTDGMDGWGRLHIVRPVVERPSFAIYQFDRVARGCLSYVLISNGQAVVIDPSYYTDEYISFLAEHEAVLTLVIDTHAHADHVSGGPALAHETGARYCLHPYDGIHPVDLLPATLPYEMLHGNRSLTLGAINLRAIHSPGHTLGHVMLVATAPDRQSYLFSGDALFINSVGRPDLGGHAATWSILAHETLYKTLKVVSSSALLLPGHYAQTTEANEHGTYSATLESIWHTNPELTMGDREAFVRHVLASLPAAPAEYVHIKRINIGLETASPYQVATLELGRNICALSAAYDQPALPSRY